jgi:enoyl-CoA hydratase
MEFVKLEKRGYIALLKLNRPQALNALNTAMLNEIEMAAAKVERDSNVRVLIITGEGRSFGAGADIGEMVGLTKAEAQAFADAGHRAFKRIDDLYIPVIAAIHGYALGGGLELALCCDIRLCSQSAKFGQPEVGLGITPGFGGTQRLPRVVGTSNAMTLTLTGKPVGAEDALRMRLVNRVYPDDEQLMDGAMEMAETIANNAPIAVHFCKVAMSRRVDRFLENDLDYEAQVFGECFETEDQRNAMTAFLAKRPKAEFKGE